MDNVPSDLYYSDLEGFWDGDWEGVGAAVDNAFCNFADQQQPPPMYLDSVDLTPDISVGRISISTNIEAQQFINKLLTYEQNPGEYQGIADFLLLGSYMDFGISGGEIKDSCVADISPTVSFYGLYDDYYHGITPHNRIGHNICIEYISNGYYLINHAGHGDWGWIYVDPVHPYNEALSSGDIQNLNNIRMWSLMYSLSCKSADFSSPYGDCFGEYWLSAGSGAGEKGLIAYLGHTKVGWLLSPGTSSSDILDRYFFGILTHCGEPRRGTNIIGLALSLAKAILPHNSYDQFLNRYELVCLNALADPTTPVWICKPTTITASYPLEIPEKLWVDFTIMVTDENGLPIPDAVVCLNKIDDIYEIKTTNSSGQAEFHIYANTLGIIKVVVSKTMCLPYRGEMRVVKFDVAIPSSHTAYSEGRKIVREPNSDKLHLAYTWVDVEGGINGPDDWSAYSLSTDGGTSWTQTQNVARFTHNPSIGLTTPPPEQRPCLAFHNAPEPYQLDRPAVISFARYDAPNWVITTIDSYPCIPGIWYPRVSPPAIRIDANNIVHMVYSGVLYLPGKAYVIYKRFDAFNPSTETVVIDSATVPEDWQPSSPSIDLQLDYPHIVYDFPAQAGEPYSEIWYKCLTEAGWTEPINISDSYNYPSLHPFIHLTNEKAIVVWSEEETPGNAESREIYRAERFLNQPPQDWTKWQEIETPNQVSDWPVLSVNGNILVWSERQLIDGKKNWEVLYHSELYGDGNLSNTPYTQSLYPSCDWRQTLTRISLYSVFTEDYASEANPWIFGIRSIKKSLPYIPIPSYTIQAGSETPSPYLVQRDGYIPYEDYPVDFDSTELIYKFTGLKSDLRYRLDITAYHESSGEWREWVRIDNTVQHLVKYKSGIPETVELPVPPASYMDDGEIIVRIKKISGDYAMCHKANLYGFEKEQEGGPQTAMGIPLNLEFGLKVLPNIVRRTAQVQFAIPEKQHIILKIYDILGRNVKTITEGIVEPGTYSYRLDLSKLSSGVYFLLLEGKKEIKTKKVLIVK